MTDPIDPGAAADGRAARVAAFGRWLAHERDLRGLSRAEVASHTKLPPTVIDALESGEEARMPPPAYVIGYLKSYAGAVGLDPDEVVLRWQEAAPLPCARRSRGPRDRRLGVAAAVVAALALAGAAAWALLGAG